MNPSYFFTVLSRYCDFNGRSRRAEYWNFVLFNALIILGLMLVGRIIGLHFLHSLYALAVFLPAMGVAVRRLHDTDRCGWWVLLCLIPILGPLIVFVFMCLDSDANANTYGPNPKL